MKKSLLAVAAMTAFAGAAQAQSSVTVYGIMDLGYVGGNSRVANGDKNTVSKGTSNQFSGSSESTSRLGFKGTEDLGGGTSAFFTVELGLAPADSTSGFKNSATTENRQSFAGLKKNGLGDFAIGTQYTTVHNSVAATDAGGTNNILGDMIYTSATGTGATVADNNFAVNNGFAAGNSYTIRAQNTLTVNTATFAGFTGHGAVIMNNTNQNQTQIANGTNGYTGGTNNQNGWGLGVDYAWQKLFITAAMQQLNAKEAYDLSNTYAASATATGVTSKATAGTPGYAIFGAGQASTLGNNVKDNQYYVGGTYDFGILKAYAQYISRKVTSQLDTGYYAKRTGEQIGVRSYITPTIEAWAQGGLGKVTAFGSSNPAANMTSWQIGSNYYLSKRTNLYAIYGQVGTSNVSIVNNTNPSSFNASNYAVGVRHTF
ncbi:porin [Polynucleobacter sp. Ross1-W9]|uniref:porin n=1 Tax=Polynucleobacter parvulilacunae TaxID=1855631 RepID=UPI001C0E608C|nr:porin [Polynucleobacter parvulilacunae]MBU3556640.1 porin [Polynucleobacter parvulilacunae]